MASKIKVDQIEGQSGSTVTLPSGQTLDLSSGTLTLPDSAVDISTAKVTGTLPVSKGGTGITSLGTANQVLGVNSGATALEFQNVSSDYVKLATITADGTSSSVSIDGYFSSTYKNYQLFGYNVKSSSGRAIWRFNLSSSADSGGNYYQVGGQHYRDSVGSNFANNPTGWGVTQFQFTHNGDDNSQAPHHAIINFFDPLNSSYLKQGFGQAIGMNQNQHDHFVYGYLYNYTTNPTGITILSSGGNITGEFTLYGLKV